MNSDQTLQTDKEVALELYTDLLKDTQKLKSSSKNDLEAWTIKLPETKKLTIKEKFSEMKLKTELVECVYNMGYEYPSIIQATSIPIITEGSDLVFQSKSGTGKTLAFAVGILENCISRKGLQAVVLTPTRVLNQQVSDVISKLGKSIDLNVFTVKPESEYENQEIIVGSPGGVLKLLNLLQNASSVKMIVVDEADAVLNLDGMGSQTHRILKILEKSQKIFFSATFYPQIKKVIEHFSPKAVCLYEKENLKPEEIKLFYLEVSRKEKMDILKSLYEYLSIGQSIIFVATKHMVDILHKEFKSDLHETACLHGDIEMSERERIVNDFRHAKARVLITTDIFSRGMDIPQVNLIINFDLPIIKGIPSIETYIHRVGRSGRFGRSGFVIDFVTDSSDLNALIKFQSELKSISKKFNLKALEEVYTEKNIGM